MFQKSAILHFPKDQIEQPIISKLISQVGVEVNILQASITPEEDGRMFVILRGSPKKVESALEYLRHAKVRVILPVKNLAWNEELCVHCTACVGQCPSSAFTVDPETCRVVFLADRCIACELCIEACGYGALGSVSDHLEKAGTP